MISRYYGADSLEKCRGRDFTGAGHYDVDDFEDTAVNNGDEFDGDSGGDDSDSSTNKEGLDSHLAADQERHIRHAPIPLPSSESPFTSEALEQVFWGSLNEVLKKDIIPGGYGVTASGWDQGVYGDYEGISLGRSGRKVSIALPPQIWWRQAVRWAQGLEILTQVLMIQNGE